MNWLNIVGRIGDLVTTYCRLRKPEAGFILDCGDDVRIFHPAAPADPEGMGR